MITEARAYELRAIIEAAMANKTDEDALACVELFPAWESGHAYTVDERVKYDGKLYRVVQAHTSQDDWTPADTPALFVEVAPAGVIPVWHQPTGAHDAYNEGDKVRYPNEDGEVYVSIVDANVWEPTVYGWVLDNADGNAEANTESVEDEEANAGESVEEETPTEPVEDEGEDEPVEESIPVWVQPTGAQDAYGMGDRVWYPAEDTTIYESLIDGNVWSPEAYPQGWNEVTL